MRLSSRVVASISGLALLLGLATYNGVAQEGKGRTKGAPSAKDEETKKVEAHPGIRVPNYFNQLEPPLTPEQRNRIYEIQEKALRDCEAVLTAPQRASLRRHREHVTDEPARKKASSKEAAAEEEEEEPVKKAPRRKESPAKKAG